MSKSRKGQLPSLAALADADGSNLVRKLKPTPLSYCTLLIKSYQEETCVYFFLKQVQVTDIHLIFKFYRVKIFNNVENCKKYIFLKYYNVTKIMYFSFKINCVYMHNKKNHFNFQTFLSFSMKTLESLFYINKYKNN